MYRITGNVCNDSEKGSQIKEMCGNRTVKMHSRRKIGMTKRQFFDALFLRAETSNANIEIGFTEK